MMCPFVPSHFTCLFHALQDTPEFLASQQGLDVGEPPVTEEDRRYIEELMERLLKTDDTSVIKQMIELLRSNTTSFEESVVAFEELEDLLSQYDNAVNWVTMGGMQLAMEYVEGSRQAPSFTTADLSAKDGDAVPDAMPVQVSADVQAEYNQIAAYRSAWLLGTALGNNKDVKSMALSRGVTAGLLHLMQQPTTTSTSLQVRHKALYALSALLRSHGAGQTQFVELAGVNALYRVAIDAQDTAVAMAAVEPGGKDARLAVNVLGRVTRLLSDLLFDGLVNAASAPIDQEPWEKQPGLEEGQTIHKEKPGLAKPSDPALTEALVGGEQRWCALYASMLHSDYEQVHSSALDIIKLLHNAGSSVCQGDFRRSAQTCMGLHSLQQRYAGAEAEAEQSLHQQASDLWRDLTCGMKEEL